jgi:hypothetical protein
MIADAWSDGWLFSPTHPDCRPPSFPFRQVSNPKRAYFRLEKMRLELTLLVKGGLYDLFEGLHDGPVLGIAELENPIEIQSSNSRLTPSAPETVPVTLKLTVNGSALEMAMRRLALMHEPSTCVNGFRVSEWVLRAAQCVLLVGDSLPICFFLVVFFFSRIREHGNASVSDCVHTCACVHASVAQVDLKLFPPQPLLPPQSLCLFHSEAGHVADRVRTALLLPFLHCPHCN